MRALGRWAVAFLIAAGAASVGGCAVDGTVTIGRDGQVEVSAVATGDVSAGDCAERAGRFGLTVVSTDSSGCRVQARYTAQEFNDSGLGLVHRSGDNFVFAASDPLFASRLQPADALVLDAMRLKVTFPGPVLDHAGGVVDGDSIVWDDLRALTVPDGIGAQGLAHPWPPQVYWDALAGAATGAAGVGVLLWLRARRAT